MKQKRNYFTLLELGIVIVASIVVAGLILFALFTGATRHASNSVAEKARQANCVSNLSLIGKAVFQYGMSYDDWYPTVRSYRTEKKTEMFLGKEYKIDAPVDGGKWLGSESYKAFALLVKEDLLTDPRAFVCPSNEKITAALPYQSLSGHVSYQWCDGLLGIQSTVSPVAADGANNHRSTGHFLRGDGSVGTAAGTPLVKWYEDDSIKKYLKSPNDLPNYSF